MEVVSFALLLIKTLFAYRSQLIPKGEFKTEVKISLKVASKYVLLW